MRDGGGGTGARLPNRREAIAAGSALAVAWAFTACDTSSALEANYPGARLRARPRAPVSALPVGTSLLDLAPGRDGRVHVPSGTMPARGWKLGVLLHGAGASSLDWEMAYPMAQELGMVLLMPESRFGAWNREEAAADAEFIDRALLRVFAGVRIDEDHIGVGGFSSGGGFALTIGLANGDLFRGVFAIAPAGLTLHERHGRPPVYIAHGTSDDSVPFSRSRDEVVPELTRRGYAVELEPFPGGHVVPTTILRKALAAI